MTRATARRAQRRSPTASARRSGSRSVADITVVTPTLAERGEMLAEAVATVAAQTVLPTAHVIMVDVHGCGPGPLLNHMSAAAKTEWVSILADDDLYDPDHLEELWNAREGADVVFSWGRIQGDDARHANQHRGSFTLERLLGRQDAGIRGCFMFRREKWAEVGGWQSVDGEDWDFLVRLAGAGAGFRPVYRETWTYRFHDTNASYEYE